MPPKKTLDLIDRDPNGMNHFVQVHHEDVIAEPSSTHSVDCIWENSHWCFSCWKDCLYNCYSCLTGIFYALAYGCHFGILAYYVVWICMPGVRFMSIVFHIVKKMMAMVYSTGYGPMREAEGLRFSRIYKVESQGPPPRPISAVLNK